MSLDNIHAGDKVVRVFDHGRGRRIVTVTRATRSQLIVGTERYQRCTGRLVGAAPFNTGHLCAPRPGEISERKLARKVGQLQHSIEVLCDSFKLSKLPLEAIERILTAMEKEYADNKIDQG